MAYILNIAAGTPECGLWCETCLLPSRARVPVHLLAESGVSDLAQYHYCTECGD